MIGRLADEIVEAFDLLCVNAQRTMKEPWEAFHPSKKPSAVHINRVGSRTRTRDEQLSAKCLTQ